MPAQPNTQLSPQQIARYAYNAGFRGAALNQAVAIAIAESGGNIYSYNPEKAAGTPAGSGSRGLWQIYGKAHPEYNNDTVYDPQANANAAYRVYLQAGGRFTPWSTFNQGLARPRYDFGSLFSGSSPATQSGSSQYVGVTGGAVGVMNNPNGINSWQSLLALPSTIPGAVQSGVASGVQQVTAAAPQAAAAAVKMIFPLSKEDYIFQIGGAVLIFIGLVFLLIAGLQSDAGKAVTEAAGKVVKTAAIAAV